jgi:hypothetical protein
MGRKPLPKSVFLMRGSSVDAINYNFHHDVTITTGPSPTAFTHHRTNIFFPILVTNVPSVKRTHSLVTGISEVGL